MRRLLDILERGAVFVGAVAMAGLAVAVVALVLLRYVFHVAPFWSEEVIRLFLLVAVFLGAAASVRGRRHIRVEFLADLLPDRLRRFWYLLLDLAALALFALLVWLGIEAVEFNHAQRSVSLQMRLSYVMWLVPACFVLAALFLVEEIVRRREPRP
ncbi:MAG: TRAP transporter small permease [Candidatus Odyssella sp.]|nr:TRAP transporter small permease [Candidatus Odyssella sp.]